MRRPRETSSGRDHAALRGPIMDAVVRLPLPAKQLGCLAVLTFVAGAAGMVVSFAFLASNHPLDVTAGAAGFVAGAVLVAAGLISISLQRRLPLAHDPAPLVSTAAPEAPLDVARWVAHFQTNHENRPEPDWAAP